jgi:hypothetical protein
VYKKCVNCKHSIKIPFSGDIVGKIMGYINNERERDVYINMPWSIWD